MTDGATVPAKGAVGLETATDDVASLAFETALARLEAVVVRLERGELSLEESLVAYEQGVRLVAAARGRLAGLQGRLEELLADGTTRKLEKKSADTEAGTRT